MKAAATEPLYRITGGLATFGPEMIRIREALESRILGWAAEIGAEPMDFPPLLRVEDLSRFDYFRHFPHLAVVASRIRPEVLADRYASDGEIETVPQADLTEGGYVLPSAACYSVYLHLEDSLLSAPRYMTTVATCCRNENAYEELERLWSFRMREIVCVGTSEAVTDHLRSFKDRVLRFADGLGLDLEARYATDPFYEPESSVARMQKLFPQKEELVYGGSLAISSLNFHRNFFGERCNIRTADGQPAFTGCVAFGLERWLYALLECCEQDVAAVLRALAP